jgi:hypothetical protein
MIYTYGITLQGTHHVKNNVVCQDAHAIQKCGDNMVIVAVADGLGSAEHSDVASKIAVAISTDYCKQNITLSSNVDKILEIINASFSESQRAIEKEVETQCHSLNQYDTTLSLAVLINDTLYYGHSGDSGIVALTTEGEYKAVTLQQRDDDGCLFPLFFRDKWVFGQFDEKVSSVFLATDGMLEILFPYLLKYAPINIHVNLARFFMDNRILRINEHGEDVVKTHIENFVKNISGEQVNDDKTVVVLINTSVESKPQPDSYYIEPDWTKLKQKHDEEWKRKAYPHLFKKKDIEIVDNSAFVSREQNGIHIEEILLEVEKQDTHTEAICEMTETKENTKGNQSKSLIKKVIDKILNIYRKKQ